LLFSKFVGLLWACFKNMKFMLFYWTILTMREEDLCEPTSFDLCIPMSSNHCVYSTFGFVTVNFIFFPWVVIVTNYNPDNIQYTPRIKNFIFCLSCFYRKLKMTEKTLKF
jgi:hypothetical protein